MNAPIRNFLPAPAHPELVMLLDGQAVTTTIAIAAGTSTTHEAVIKLVRAYRADLEEFGGVRFEIQPFQTAGGEQTREFAILNEEQSALILAYMRNGEAVRQFKKALIREFFKMRSKLRETPADPLASLPPEQRVLISLMVENAAIKAGQARIEATQADQQASIVQLEAKQTAQENGAAFFTVIGYGTYHGIKFSLADASTIGRKASALSKASGIPIDKVRDPRFGIVNSYHETMLDQAIAAVHGGM